MLALLRRDGLGEKLIDMYFTFREIKALNLRAPWQLVCNHGGQSIGTHFQHMERWADYPFPSPAQIKGVI